MKKFIAVSAVAISLIAGSAFAACTQEEAQTKATALSNKMTEVAQKDQNKMMAVSQEMQTRAVELQKKPGDMDALCKFYDDMLKKLQ